MPSPKKKVTLYFSATMLEETQHEAIRQDRSISWIIQAAWKMSREEVRRLPSAVGLTASPAPGAPSPVLPEPGSGANAGSSSISGSISSSISPNGRAKARS